MRVPQAQLLFPPIVGEVAPSRLTLGRTAAEFVRSRDTSGVKLATNKRLKLYRDAPGGIRPSLQKAPPLGLRRVVVDVRPHRCF